MKHQEKRLPLSKLIINTNNDRFEPVENEIEAIDRMLEAQGDKIYQLAKHIVEFDLSPKPFYVITYNNKYVVGDGNRRTTALKLMKNPKIGRASCRERVYVLV